MTRKRRRKACACNASTRYSAITCTHKNKQSTANSSAIVRPSILGQFLRCHKPVETSFTSFDIFPTRHIELDLCQCTRRHTPVFASQKRQQLFKPGIVSN